MRVYTGVGSEACAYIYIYIEFSKQGNTVFLYFDIYNKNETKGYPTLCFMQLHKCGYNP